MTARNSNRYLRQETELRADTRTTPPKSQVTFREEIELIVAILNKNKKKNVAAFEHVNVFLSQAPFLDSSRLTCEKWMKLWIPKGGKAVKLALGFFVFKLFFKARA